MAWTCPTCGRFCTAQSCMVFAGIQPAGMVLHNGGIVGNYALPANVANVACAPAYQGGYVDWNLGGRAGRGVQAGNYWPYR